MFRKTGISWKTPSGFPEIAPEGPRGSRCGAREGGSIIPRAAGTGGGFAGFDGRHRARATDHRDGAESAASRRGGGAVVHRDVHRRPRHARAAHPLDADGAPALRGQLPDFQPPPAFRPRDLHRRPGGAGADLHRRRGTQRRRRGPASKSSSTASPLRPPNSRTCATSADCGGATSTRRRKSAPISPPCRPPNCRS